MNKGVVVIPTDALARIVGSTLDHGWFSGFESDAEGVFVVLSTWLGDGEIVSEAFSRLCTHRTGHALLGTYKARLLEWWVAPRGFAERFSSPVNLPPDEFRSLLAAEFAEEGRVVAAVELGDDGPKITPIRVVIKNGVIRSRPLDVIVLGTEKQPFARATPRLVQSLASKSVIIVGLGSGGAEIALDLACAGVGKLTLIDYDRLNTENYLRFIAGSTELGRRKIDIVSSAIRDRELPTEVTGYALDVVSDADRFRGILDGSTDLLICATDSVSSRRTVNAAAVLLHLPCIVAGLLDDGRIGEVLRVVPFQFPCYECVRMELGTVLEMPASGDRASTPYLGSEEAALSGTALRSDVTLVASLTAQVALHQLVPERFPELPASYIVWGREADHSRPDPFRFDAPFSTNYVRIGRRKDCPLCGADPSDLMGLDIQKAADEILAGIIDY